MHNPVWCLAIVVWAAFAGTPAELHAGPRVPPVQPVARQESSPLLRAIPLAIPPSPYQFEGPAWHRPAPPARKPDNRTAVSFKKLDGLKVAWQSERGSFDTGVGTATPREAGFKQGERHRLRLTRTLPDKSIETFEATLEVPPATAKTAAFLHRCSVPVSFTEDEFAQAKSGEPVVKVLYLPDPVYQDFSTVVGPEEVCSTRLEPGSDPVKEASRRGTILATVRMNSVVR